MVYGRARKRVVLYGGDRGRNTPASDTWSWNGREWRLLATDGPSARGSHMAYDARRDRIVLFGGGGAGGSLYNDTWEWDGERWQLIVRDGQTSSPPARALAGIAYDERRGRVVLVGGFAGFDAANRHPRGGRHRLAYDTRANATLLYGGWTPNNVQTSDLWRLNQNRCSAISP